MSTNTQVERFQNTALRRALMAGLVLAIAVLALLGSTLPSTASSPQTGASLPPKATPTPGGPELVEKEASFTVGDIGQFSHPPSVAAQRVQPDGSVVILDEGFEGAWPPPGWAAQPNWGASSCRASAGSKSAWVEGSAGLACGSDYFNDENAFLIYGPFSLADATAASLSFQLWLNSETDYDFLCRMVSVDGTSFGGFCTHGKSGGWIERALDLTALAGESSVWIALVWNDDTLRVRAEGAFVDDVRLTKTTGEPTATPTPTATITPTRWPTSTPTPTYTPLPTPSWWWRLERVQGSIGGSVYGVSFTSLAFDSAGRPCIGFVGTQDVKLACWNGSLWEVEGIGADWPEIYVSLAFDHLGRPHMAYFYSFVDHDLWYAYKDASGWHHEKISGVSFTGGYHSLAVDTNGNPHIAYDTGSAVDYAYRDGSGWHIESIGASGQTDYPSLALDKSGYPHISYQLNNGDLMYAFKDATDWHHETVDTEGRTGAYNSLALDAQGNPHISYYQVVGPMGSGSCDLKYAQRGGVNWTIETVHDASVRCEFAQNNTSLKLDGSEQPHISYYQPQNQALWYAYRDGSGWHTELVASGNVGRGNSLAFSPVGNPYISYVDEPAVNLAVRLDAPQPSPTPTPTNTPTSTPTPVPPGEAQSYWPDLAPAAGSGVIVVWYDNRFGPHTDGVFACRFGQDGNPLWPADVQVSIGPGTFLARYPGIATDDDGNSFTVWQSGDGGKIYAQKLDSEGNYLWSKDMLIYGRPNGTKPRVDLDRSGNWYVLWNTYWSSCSGPYGAPCSEIQLNKLGSSPWDEVSIVRRSGGELDLAVTSDGSSRLVWLEYKTGGGSNIFGLSLSADSYWRWPNPVRINSYTGSVPQAFPHHPRVAANATGDTYFVWTDGRNGNWDIYAQKFDVNVGHRLWANDVHVNSDTTTANQIDPDLVVDASGYIYVVWADDRSGIWDIYAQKLTPEGARVWSRDLQINTTSRADTRSKPVITLDASGFLYIAWENQLTDQHDIYMQSYTVSGARCWSVDVAVEGLSETPSVICAPPPTPTPTPTATPTAPWLNWREPGKPLLVDPHGRQVTVDYGNIVAPATLTATLSGPAVFAGGTQVLTADITNANGSYTLDLQPAAGAIPGDTFTLEVTLAGLRLERVGTIAGELYLPLVLQQ